MTGSWPKIIRDPIHNIVPFEDTKCDQLLLKLINTKEFQRLRRIKQLGLSQLVFPGADHSRFAHSIGVMQIARKFLEKADKLCPGLIDEENRTIVLSAALLHDIGHGPFSHAFEKVTGDDHEKRTSEIIRDESTKVNETLRSFTPDLPDKLQVFFDEDVDEPTVAENGVPAWLTQIITSQLDADRFDYLLRDTYATGTDYGRFDLNWLLQHLQFDEDKKRFYLGHKALFAAESYVFARYHMYRSVYFHKTTRSAEVMLRLLFKRYKTLLENCDTNEERLGIVPNAPIACSMAFSDSLTLHQYLLLDDHTITEFAKACVSANDDVLRDMSLGLLNRELFKATDVSDNLGPEMVAFSDKVKEIVSGAGFDAEFYFEYDAPSDIAYKLYDPDAEKPATQIYIADRNGEQRELSKCSESIYELAKRYKLVRYYYPEAVRDVIRSEAVPLLKG